MDSIQNETARLDVMSLTADIFSSFVSGNKLSVADLPGFIGQIHAALDLAARGKTEPGTQNLEPAVPIKSSSSPITLFALKTGKNSRASNDTFAVHSI